MPIAAHILWLCGLNDIPGVQTTLRIVSVGDTCSGVISARSGGNAAATASVSAIARSSRCLMALRGSPSSPALTHSSMNTSMSNISA